MEIFDIIKNTNIISNSDDIQNTTDYNFDNIMKIMQMIKIFQDNKKKSEESEISLELNSSGISSIKTLLPLLNLPNQSNIDTMIKLIEMKNIINYYKNTVNSMSIEKKSNIKKNVLLAIKPNLDREKQDFVDALVKVLETQKNENINKFKENENEYRL